MGSVNFLLEEAQALKADGVIFHPILLDKNPSSIFKNAIAFYPIGKLNEVTAYPKSDRTYYRLIDGKVCIIE